MDVTAEGTDPVGPPTRPVLALARPGSRAVVIGVGGHVPESPLPAIPAVAATVVAVRDSLADQCGMEPGQIVSATDPESAARFLASVNQAASQAEDVLLLYYIGHGLVSLAGEFFLATHASTDREVMLPVEALPFAAVRGALSASRARHVVVILDCCFSGRASGAFAAAVADAFELTNVRGSYLLSATSATEQALAPEGQQHTAFSGALLDLLRDGDPGTGRELTLEDIYRQLERSLPAAGAPVPQRRAAGDAGRLAVSLNPRARPATSPRPGSRERPGASSPARPCPYPGLDAFTAADTDYFYGRERLVGEILRVLAADGHDGPLAIVGRSGAGKSSLLQAGLLPAIKAGRLDVPGSRHWPQLVMKPGEQPMTTLAERLAAPRDDLAPDGLIICVDQFEEVFTTCTDEAERRAFIQALCARPADDGAPRAQVILALRADFYGRCLDYAELAPMVRAGQVPVRPMNRGELRSAIEDPAAAVGLQLEEGLTGRLLRDLDSAEGPGRDADIALPLLAFALQETWQQSDKQVLTLSDYEATGGIWGAVTQQAEAVYESLDPEQDAAKRLLLSMVQFGDETDDVRRRVSVADLLNGRPIAEQATINQALGAYVKARLIAVDDGTAEIVHEALLRAWPRLRQWIEADRQNLLDRQRLAAAARAWQSGDGPLYSGVRLEEARAWVDQEGSGPADGSRGAAPSDLERRFIAASTQARRKRRIRRGSFLGGVVAAVLLLIAGGVYAVQQRAGNQASQAVRSSVDLAQEAGSLRTTDPAGATWLSLAAYNSAKTSQARTQLYDSLATPYPLTLPGHGKGPAGSVAYSPDGVIAAAVWSDGSMRLWRVSDPLRPVLLATLKVPAGGYAQLAFSPDGRTLAVHALDSLELWRVGAGPGRPVLLSATRLTDQATQTTNLSPVLAKASMPVAFSPGGKTVATGDGTGRNGRLMLWNVTDPEHPALAANLTGSVRSVPHSVAFSPDGTTLAAGTGNDGKVNSQVLLWDVRNPARPVLEWSKSNAAGQTVQAVAFSPVGHLLVAAGAGKTSGVLAWNVTDPARPVSVQTGDDSPPDNALGTDALYSVAFHPGSDTFLTADSDGDIGIWTGAPGTGFDEEDNGDLPSPSVPVSVAYSPDGQRVLTGREDGVVTLWTSLMPLLPGSIGPGAAGSATNGNGTLMTVTVPGPGNSSRTELWNVSHPLRPVQVGALPGNAGTGNFLPDGNTLLILNSTNPSAARLWNVTASGKARPGATLKTNKNAYITAETWGGSGNGLLFVADTHDIRIYNIRNIGHPVLDSTLKVTAAGVVGFSGDLFAADVKASPSRGETELWNIANPRHPVLAWTVPNNDLQSPTYYNPSPRMLTTGGSYLSVTDTNLWALRGSRRVSPLAVGVPLDPNSITNLSGDTWTALSSSDQAIDVWSSSDPRKPAIAAALPLPTGSAGPLSATASQDGWLTATGIDPLAGDGPDIVDLAQISASAKSISDYAQVPGDSSDYTFLSRGTALATDLDSFGESGLGAFDPQGLASQGSGAGYPGVVYPTNSGSVYNHLCVIATRTPVSVSWTRDLPATYYRLPCS